MLKCVYVSPDNEKACGNFQQMMAKIWREIPHARYYPRNTANFCALLIEPLIDGVKLRGPFACVSGSCDYRDISFAQSGARITKEAFLFSTFSNLQQSREPLIFSSFTIRYNSWVIRWIFQRGLRRKKVSKGSRTTHPYLERETWREISTENRRMCAFLVSWEEK